MLNAYQKDLREKRIKCKPVRKNKMKEEKYKVRKRVQSSIKLLGFGISCEFRHALCGSVKQGEY